MSASWMGARVAYCGHNGYFMADIYLVAGANVIRANGAVTPANITRPQEGEDLAKLVTHHVTDSHGGFWRPDLGVFVVPQAAVTLLKTSTRTKKKTKK